ncbi:MAG: hypothetical protein ACTSVM_02995 [Candidatus Ranarchaeia archaeon]
MIAAIIVILVIMAAFLAIDIEESTYAVGAFGIVIIGLSVLFFLLNAIFAALFELATGAGILAVFFLSGEMLEQKKSMERSRRRSLISLIIGFASAIPAVIGTEVLTPIHDANTLEIGTPEILWNLRSIDLFGQVLAILIVAIGILLIFSRKREET